MSDKIIDEFKKKHGISRAIYWNKRSGDFVARAYSAIEIAMKTNEAFSKFKLEYTS